MKEVVFGEEIRRLRKAKGWSQEKLADGICSASTLSRIENGCQVPSRRVFRSLMEHLEGPGIFSYAQFLSSSDYKLEIIQEELLEAMEGWQVERAKDLLWELEQIMDYDNPKLAQFFEMSKQVCFQMCGADAEGYARKCLQILQMGGANYNEENLASQMKECLGVRRGRIDIAKCEYVDLWVLNNLAVGLMWQKDYQRAYDIFIFMSHQLENNKLQESRNWKMKGAIAGNMAICLLQMKRPWEARECMRKAYLSVRRKGGIVVLRQLLWIMMDVSVAIGDSELYYQEQLLLKTVYAILPKEQTDEAYRFQKQWGRKEFLIL